MLYVLSFCCLRIWPTTTRGGNNLKVALNFNFNFDPLATEQRGYKNSEIVLVTEDERGKLMTAYVSSLSSIQFVTLAGT